MEISKIILTYFDVKVHILSVKEVNIFSDYYRSSFSKEIQKQDHVFKPNNRYPKIPFYLRFLEIAMLSGFVLYVHRIERETTIIPN